MRARSRTEVGGQTPQGALVGNFERGDTWGFGFLIRDLAGTVDFLDSSDKHGNQQGVGDIN